MVQPDTVIRQFEHEVEGTNPALRHQKRYRDLATLTDEQRAIVRREVIEGIDGAIHHLLWLFEQHDVNGFDVIFVGTDDDPVPQPVSVSDLSDGLGGEPYAEDGWISKYSRYEESCPGSSTVSGTSPEKIRNAVRLEARSMLRSMSGCADSAPERSVPATPEDLREACRR
jgi:hypothetical protein